MSSAFNEGSKTGRGSGDPVAADSETAPSELSVRSADEIFGMMVEHFTDLENRSVGDVRMFRFLTGQQDGLQDFLRLGLIGENGKFWPALRETGDLLALRARHQAGIGSVGGAYGRGRKDALAWGFKEVEELFGVK